MKVYTTLLGQKTDLELAPLLFADTMETYWDSRIDLLQRKLSQRTDKLKSRAEVLGDYFTTIKTPKADVARENIDREIKKLQLKVGSLSLCPCSPTRSYSCLVA